MKPTVATEQFDCSLFRPNIRGAKLGNLVVRASLASMNPTLHLIVDNTKTCAEKTATDSENLLKRLLAEPCSFSDIQFNEAVDLLKPQISFEVYDALFHHRLFASQTRDRLFDRALMATISDSPDADLLISKLDQIERLGFYQVLSGKPRPSGRGCRAWMAKPF